MTLSMPDSIYPANLPAGYPAYLAYADGEWATEDAVRAAHPQASTVVLTVTGTALEADGIDCEEGNPGAVSAADWVRRKLAADPASRPVVYADLATPGYSMTEVLAALASLGIPRDRVRVLTAHYDGQHVCSPAHGCRDAAGNLITFSADGTQWTDSFPGVNGSQVDMSLLADGFFAAPQTWEEKLVTLLPVIRQGSTDVQAVKNWQGLLVARGYDLGTTGLRRDGVDGSWGDVTQRATLAFQAASRIKQDGIVGPVTYTAALTA